MSEPAGPVAEGRVALLVLRMGGRPCAIRCEHIVEIVPRVRLSPLPDAPLGVLGVINARGRVVPVTDVRARLSEETPPPWQEIVIVEANGKPLGVVVDEVLDVTTVSAEAIEGLADVGGAPLPRVVRIEGDLVLVLSPGDLRRDARDA